VGAVLDRRRIRSRVQHGGTRREPSHPTPSPAPTDVPAGTLPSGRIAFAALRDAVGDGACGRLGVYVLNAGAGQPAYVADGCNPVLSPDGRLIAYTRGGHIFVISADGGQETNVSGDDLIDSTTNPAWSPDGKRIAFSSNREGKSEIYLVDADGSRLTRITNSPVDRAAGRLGLDPIWSPDGRRIAFTMSEDAMQANANWDVYVVNIDGSQLTRLTDNAARDGLIGWSPDGRRMLFWSERDGGKQNIYIMDVDGSRQTRLTDGGFDQWASWSPDGKRIALASGRDRQLYVMNPDSGNVTRITKALTNVFNPVWSRDGQYIVFGSFSADWKTGALYAIRSDGNQLTHLNTPGMWLQWAQR